MLLFKVLIINFSILTSVAVSFTAFKSVAFKKWRAFIICSIFFSTQEQEYTNSLVHLEGVKLGLLIFPHSSGGKESICNAGNLGLISWVRKIPQGRDRPRTAVFVGFPGGSGNKESTSNAGDWSSITGLGRFLKKEMATHRSIFAYKTPWMEEPRAATVHEITKSWTRLSN